MFTKQCSRCTQVKELSEFGVDNRRDIPKAICRACDREVHRLRYYDPQYQQALHNYRAKKTASAMSVYAERKQNGLCVICGTPSVTAVYCDEHRKVHIERQKMLRRKARDGRICPGCQKAALSPRRRLCDECASTTGELYKARQKAWRDKQKLIAFEKYGGPHCVCCGQGNPAFLSLDHVNNDGASHRRAIFANSLGRGRMYGWVRRHGYPPGFQVLCFNCNCGRQYNGGICPHKQAA